MGSDFLEYCVKKDSEVEFQIRQEKEMEWWSEYAQDRSLET